MNIMVRQHAESNNDFLTDSTHADTPPSGETDNIVNIEDYRPREKSELSLNVGKIATVHFANDHETQPKQNSIHYPHPGNLRFQVMDAIRIMKIQETLDEFWAYHHRSRSKPPQPKNYDP